MNSAVHPEIRLGTLADGSRDGALAVISADGGRFLRVAGVAETMLDAVERWDEVASALAEAQATVELMDCDQSRPVEEADWMAAMPRSWQWLDGSAFENHARLMRKALGNVEDRAPGMIRMYQGASHLFHAPLASVPFVSESHEIDFEGEFGVVVGEVPMGVSVAEAGQYIRLVVLLNDWSLRKLGAAEMRTGFGWIQGKPPCSMAPYAVTPAALGDSWVDGRVDLTLNVTWNGQRFGAVPGREMDYGFDTLIAHAAATRTLCAGTIIGSGTVSSRDWARAGSACIAERRAIETIEGGAPRTDYIRFDDHVKMSATDAAGTAVFGEIDQTIVQARHRRA